MSRIVNLRVLSAVLPAIVAIVFFVVACSSTNQYDPNQQEPGGNGQGENSSASNGDGGDNEPPMGDPGLRSSASNGEDPMVSSPSQGEVSSNSSGDGSSSAGTAVSSSSGRSSGSGSSSSARSSSSASGRSSASSAEINPNPGESASFTETVGGVSFDMVYIPGATFTLGCELSSGCPVGLPTPVSGVKVSNYFIGKAEVTQGLYKAVMGSNKSCASQTSSTAVCGNLNFYGLMEFACELSKKTGKNYRMPTEAEWEYAAKTYTSSLQQIGNGTLASGEEWVYNSWDVDKYTGGEDPIGPKTIVNGKATWGHTQKTRRDADVLTGDKKYSRLIRSIDGFGPSLRLALSKDMAFPPDMTPSCDIHAPEEGEQPANSYRDRRWITGDNKKWSTGSIAIGTFSLSVWEDGTAKLGSTNGQWFTSNNINFVFVSTSGSVTRFPYIFLDEENASLISDKSFMSGGYIGRIVKESGNVTKPSVSGLKSGEELAKAQSDFNTYYKMVNMENMPKTAKDSRLLDGPNDGWFQNNNSMAAQHHYRKDIDTDEFRFTVNQNGTRTILSNGEWFTINNTFLRVTGKNGYVTDYLYTVVPGSGNTKETLYHNSYQGYERGDFRMFEKTSNSSSFPCGSICSGEIPKNGGTSMYSSREDGKSTFVPAKCPTGGCN